ncbi:MAG: hypothetical protein QW597_02690 [Thermoplasmataceae archaeon]
MPARKRTVRETKEEEPYNSMVLDGDDYLVLELLKWPGETDKEAIQRVLREALEVPKLKEFVEKLAEQINKILGESRDVVSIVGIEDSLTSYKKDAVGRNHIWHPKDQYVPILQENDADSAKERGSVVKHHVQDPRPAPEEIRAEDPILEIPKISGAVSETTKPETVREVKPKNRLPNIPSGNPNLIRELMSKPVSLKTGKTERMPVKRYAKGTKEYEDEILRLKQALEGPWHGY